VLLKGSFTYTTPAKKPFSQILAKKDKIPIHADKQLVKAGFLTGKKCHDGETPV